MVGEWKRQATEGLAGAHRSSGPCTPHPRRPECPALDALHTPDIERIVTEEGRQVVGCSIEEAADIVTRDIRRFAEVTQRIGLGPANERRKMGSAGA